jgi:SAM-dependent methyltransferase
VRRSRVLQANWYDYPQYYDIGFQGCTDLEANFIEAACRKYCRFEARRFLEPACGSGRLITEFAARGYQVTGFDLSQRALTYLRQRLARRRLDAQAFEAEMSFFRVGRSVDAAYCMLNTFRHLLSEQAARAHLECIASSLRAGGIYVVGMKRVLGIDYRRRIEHVSACLTASRGSKEFRLRHEYQLRTYTRRQFRRLLASVRSLELCDTYDFPYDIDRPVALKDEICYGVFVLARR